MEGGEDKGEERGGMNLLDAVINSRTAQSQGGNSLRESERDICFMEVICAKRMLLKGTLRTHVCVWESGLHSGIGKYK